MTELTDKMRTCAAAIAAGMDKHFHGEPSPLYTDAADLLLEASNVIEGAPPPLGEPMAILEPIKAAGDLPAIPGHSRPVVPRATWTTNAGDLPPVPNSRGYRHPRVCPSCDSRATKRVFRHENKVMLACPVCAVAWEYQP
jgi:hypothetical protein